MKLQPTTSSSIFPNLNNEAIAPIITRYQQGEKDFRGIDLASVDLSGINLQGADLRSANFFNAELRCAILDRADLRGANFKNANLKSASLKDCDLNGANLTDTQLSHAILDGANLSEVLWVRVKCHRTSMLGATLPDSSKWLFKTFASGKALSLNDLLIQNIRSRSSRFRLGEFLFVLLLWGGFELLRLGANFWF